MALITTDFSPLTKHVQLALEHPSSRLFGDQRLWSSVSTPLNKLDCSLAESGTQTLAGALDAISESRKHIASVCESLTELENQVQTALARCRALVAPIRRLPIEILQVIFRLVDQLEQPKVQTDMYPPVVSQICTLWREVAIATPSLWTHIFIPLGPRNLSDRLERLTLWMQRSASHHFDLVIGHDTDTRPTSKASNPKMRDTWTQVGIEVARAVEAHGSALNSLVVDVDFHDDYPGAAGFSLVQTWFESDAFSMPNLKTLKLNALWPSPTQAWATVRDIFVRKAPNLEHVDVKDYDSCALFALPCTNFKIFRGQPNSETFINLTTSAPSLEILELWYLEDISPTMNPVGPTSPPLLHLSSLHLVSTNFLQVTTHLPPLPALRHLVLSHEDNGETINFVPIIQAWGSQLTFLGLSIDPDATTDTYIQDCLSLTPNLEALRIGPMTAHQLQTIKLPRLLYCDFYYDCLPTSAVQSLTEFSTHAKTQFPVLRILDVTYPHSGPLALFPPHEYGDDAHLELDPALVLRTATGGLATAGVTVNIQEIPWSPNKRAFDGHYFEEKGGIFDRLDPAHNPEGMY